MKVLIVKLSSLGDIIHAVPVVRYLRESFTGDLEIHWLVNDNFVELVNAAEIADRVISFNRSTWKKKGKIFSNIKGFFKKIRELRAEKYDIAIDLQCLFRSSLIPFLARIPRRAGFDRTREGARILLNELACVRHRKYHAVEENLEVIIQAFDLPRPESARKLLFHLTVPEDRENNVEKILRERAIISDRLILINPNSRWESKKWGNSRYEALIRRILQDHNVFIGLIGTRDEREYVQALAQIDKRVFNLAGTTDILELYALMKKARLLVTNDSGPMHMASAAGLKTLAVFGPTSPRRTGPFWESRVMQAELLCSPCFKKECPYRDRRNMHCMESVSVDEVYQAVDQIIKT